MTIAKIIPTNPTPGTLTEELYHIEINDLDLTLILASDAQKRYFKKFEAFIKEFFPNSTPRMTVEILDTKSTPSVFPFCFESRIQDQDWEPKLGQTFRSRRKATVLYVPEFKAVAKYTQEHAMDLVLLYVIGNLAKANPDLQMETLRPTIKNLEIQTGPNERHSEPRIKFHLIIKEK